MIKYITKDITTVQVGVVAHGCNCLGLMGSGVALAVRKKWPAAFAQYRQLVSAYNDPSELLGIAQIVKAFPPADLYVANCFTQVSCGTDKVHAKRAAIYESLANAASFAELNELPLYLPKIGCGLGGLVWDNDVVYIIESIADEYPDVNIYVCDI
jgi:O-acetyl-ADP-ribose deacetylase (regulator of RNase III)